VVNVAKDHDNYEMGGRRMQRINHITVMTCHQTNLIGKSGKGDGGGGHNGQIGLKGLHGQRFGSPGWCGSADGWTAEEDDAASDLASAVVRHAMMGEES